MTNEGAIVSSMKIKRYLLYDADFDKAESEFRKWCAVQYAETGCSGCPIYYEKIEIPTKTGECFPYWVMAEVEVEE